MLTCIARLHQFEFIVGHQMQQRIISRAPPAVALKLRQGKKSLNYVNGVDVPWVISVALQKVDTFFLDRHTTIKDLSAFGLQNLHKLRVCVLGECNRMHAIVDGSRSSSLSYMLCTLELLGVFYMKNLKSILKGVSSRPCFIMMKSLQLYNCPKLKTIFTLDLVDNLYVLEEVVIEDCPKVIKGESRWWKRLNWSEAGWEQNQVDHLKKIFSPIDEERDIMTQLTTDEDDIVKNDANDTDDNYGDDDNYDDLDDDDDDDVSEEEDEYADE
ncbi:hypothetical protein L6164_037306 [Bauhinia variegata]|uniref:Uncharacterized protein n=1 Tax=Bauhinia variegata TaxID=167791 RepID=A0ACB9KJQ6_BAUVA|nr:hypothetical protein L6164_037306 [Bauhinia variegata]